MTNPPPLSDSTNPTLSGGSPPLVAQDHSAIRRRLLQGGLSAAPVLMTIVSRPVLGQQCQTPSAALSGNISAPASRVAVCSGQQPNWWVSNTDAWPAPFSAPATTTNDTNCAAPTTTTPDSSDGARHRSDRSSRQGRQQQHVSGVTQNSGSAHVKKNALRDTTQNGSHAQTNVQIATSPTSDCTTVNKNVGISNTHPLDRHGRKATMFHDVFGGRQYSNPPLTLHEGLKLRGSPQDLLASHVSAALLNAATNRTPVLDVQRVKTIWNEYSSTGYYAPTAGVKWGPLEIVSYLQTTMPL